MARSSQLMEQVLALRARLDALTSGGKTQPGLADQLWGPGRPAMPPERLHELDAAIERAGLHTLADAQLFARLMKDDARIAQAGERLTKGAVPAVREVARRVDRLERLQRLGMLEARALADLEDLWSRLLRVVKVAALLSDPEGQRGAPLWEPLPSPARFRAQDARVALAEFLSGRATGNGKSIQERGRDLQVAHELLLRATRKDDRRRVQELRLRVGRLRRDMAHLRRADPLRELARASQARDGNAMWEAANHAYRDALSRRDDATTGAARRVLAALEPRMVRPLAEAIVEADEEVGRSNPATRDRLVEIALGLDPAGWTSFDIAADAGAFFDVDEESDAAEDAPPPPSPLVRVPYPSAFMAIEPAEGLEELQSFVISDPRLVLYDLASQRQLVRAHYAPRAPEPPKARRGAVRVYILDASSSMSGARARFRDAVLMAELQNLTVRAGQGRPFEPIYFAFFNELPSDLQRVESPEQAAKAIGSLHGRSGGDTDITLAALTAFGAIRDARGKDPELCRATVVLVTDGQDRVDAQAIESARAPVGGVEITLSFIALGRENDDLKALVVSQREAGKRAFYYFLDDEEVAGARGLFDTELRTLLPGRAAVELAPDDPELEHALAALLSIGEMGVAPGPAPSSRFEAFFPGEPPTGEAMDAQTPLAVSLVEAVAETVAMAPAEGRADEAVVLLEHLLHTYAMNVPQYLRALAAFPLKGRSALEKIRLLSARGSP